jgi:hypothetical protein
MMIAKRVTMQNGLDQVCVSQTDGLTRSGTWNNNAAYGGCRI